MNALLKQYQTIKAKYKDAVVLFRVGDYYETFGEDAKAVAQCLYIPLIQLSVEEGMVMAGFHFHSLDCHLRTLVKASHRVAVCEPLEDPKKAKGLVKRGVTDYLQP